VKCTRTDDAPVRALLRARPFAPDDRSEVGHWEGDLIVGRAHGSVIGTSWSPHLIERRSPDCVRNGTTTLFAALNTATGNITARCQPRHRHQESLGFCRQVARTYPGVELHLKMDNYATHKHPAVKD
jgi:hypothetical protein